MISKPMKYWIPASLIAGASLHAQDNGARSAVRSDSSIVIEEVIISAQRHDQNAQKVGITLSTVEYEALERGLYQTLPDIAYRLPNVEMFEDFGGQGMPVWVIRGVGLQDFNANNTPTAAVYVDEVYQSSVAQGGSGVFDTERVEVLKGPQGGLYGRNTSGGVVRQLTRRAELNNRDGYLSAAVGSWGERIWQAGLNQPLSDSIAVRVAGRVQRSDDAWQTSLATGKPHGEKDLWDLRGWWLVEPSERSRMEIKVYGGQNRSELPLARAVGLYNADGSYCSAVLAGQRDDENCLSYGGLVATMNGEPDTVPFPAIQKSNGATSLSNAINRFDNRQLGSTVILTHDLDNAGLGPVQLQAITNYEKFDFGLTFDYDGSSAELGHQITASAIETLSQELRLASAGSGNMRWNAGLLLSRDEFLEDRQYRLKDNTPVGSVHGQLDYAQVTRSRALYAQTEYSLTERWSVNAALRYTREWKTY